MVVSQQTTESLAAFDRACDLADFFARGNDLVFEPLVISLGVIVLQELVDGTSQ